jgi:hypothetical protein
MSNILLSPKVSTLYIIECWQWWLHDALGKPIKRLISPRLRWRESFGNIVVTAGLNKLLDATFKTGLATPAWYVGLKGTGSIVAGDTMGSHAGWSEITPYSNANRPTFTPGSVAGGSVDNSASKAVFNINATDTVYGSFLTDNNTKGGTTGTLYGGGDFAANRPVASGDTLNCQLTITQTTG